MNGGAQSQGFPEPAEHQVRADSLHLDRFGLAGGVRVDDGQFLAETQAGTEQGLQLAAGLQDIQATHGGEHALAHLAGFAKALDDLQVGVGAGAFDAKVHRPRVFPLRRMAVTLTHCNRKPRDGYRIYHYISKSENRQVPKMGRFRGFVAETASKL